MNDALFSFRIFLLSLIYQRDMESSGKLTLCSNWSVSGFIVSVQILFTFILLVHIHVCKWHESCPKGIVSINISTELLCINVHLNMSWLLKLFLLSTVESVFLLRMDLHCKKWGPPCTALQHCLKYTAIQLHFTLMGLYHMSNGFQTSLNPELLLEQRCEPHVYSNNNNVICATVKSCNFH